MALSECLSQVDSSGRELLQHGTITFPIACYHDDFGKMDVPWHWHEELELAIVTDGSAIVTAGSQKYTLHAGDGFFINAGVLHAAWDLDHTRCRFHSLCFHPRLVGGSLDSVFYQDFVAPLCRNKAFESLLLRPSLPWQRHILEAAEQAWQLCTNEPASYQFGVRTALSEIIWELVKHMPSLQPQTSGKNARDAERIKTMLTHIHENFSSELTTGSIAASAAISESEALRCFRATIGTSPIQYVKQYRIQQATARLGTSEKISDIAVQCGFQDMSYFTKSFREFKGMTPSQYRKNQRM